MRSFQKIVFPFLLIVSAYATAQVRIQLTLSGENISPSNNYYLAGSINGWNPKDSAFRFVDNSMEIVTEANAVIQFKLTRGSWNKVECKKGGGDIENRIIKAVTDTTIILSVESWKDEYKVVEKKHTASPNVILLDTAFYIPQLNRTRAVRVYLPPDYNAGSKKYPVLYMCDGQNCFDEYTSGFGEWHVDETLDHFFDSCKKSMIVVAVDHGESHRLQEYNPYDVEKFGKGEGDAYCRFLVETLKPHIDSIYRTRSDKQNTHIAGSSMGAVISMWAVIKYPEVFGNAGIFSPAFWLAEPMYKDAEKRLPQLKKHSFFFYAGGSESKTMVADTKAMDSILVKGKRIQSQVFIDDAASHNEAAWSKWFPVYLKWILR